VAQNQVAGSFNLAARMVVGWY